MDVARLDGSKIYCNYAYIPDHLMARDIALRARHSQALAGSPLARIAGRQQLTRAQIFRACRNFIVSKASHQELRSIAHTLPNEPAVLHAIARVRRVGRESLSSSSQGLHAQAPAYLRPKASKFPSRLSLPPKSTCNTFPFLPPSLPCTLSALQLAIPLLLLSLIHRNHQDGTKGKAEVVQCDR